MMPPESIKAETEYVVLKRPTYPQNSATQSPTSSSQQGWSVVGQFEGRDASTAIKAAVGDPLTEGVSGTYVAVPARSWKPVAVDVKVERTLVLEEAKS